MQSFVLRAVKPKKDDIFSLFPNDEYVFFFCESLKDLQKTIRHITPKGYRVRTTSWFSKYLKMNNYDLVLNSGFLITKETYRIIKVPQAPVEYNSIIFVNNEQKEYPLKIFTTEAALLKIKILFN